MNTENSKTNEPNMFMYQFTESNRTSKIPTRISH